MTLNQDPELGPWIWGLIECKPTRAGSFLASLGDAARKAFSALGNPPARDWKYRSWIRTLPCVHCGTTDQVEAAHTGSDGGMRQKSSDYSCVPLCHDCHQASPISYHRNREAMGIDWQALVARLNSMWFAHAHQVK